MRLAISSTLHAVEIVALGAPSRMNPAAALGEVRPFILKGHGLQRLVVLVTRIVESRKAPSYSGVQASVFSLLQVLLQCQWLSEELL